MTIKPEDVPDFLAGLARERFPDAYTGTISKEQIALFVQDAIEAGVVSPPCYAYRYTGELQKSGGVVELYPNRIHQEDQFGHYEHWKGQTE